MSLASDIVVTVIGKRISVVAFKPRPVVTLNVMTLF